MAERAPKTSGRARHSGPLYPGGPTADQLRVEVDRQRQVPGIVFAVGPAGRLARIAGTGIEVFEVVSTYQALGEDRGRLARRYDWLTPPQLDAALAYATAFPDEIERRLAEEAALERRHRDAQPAP